MLVRGKAEAEVEFGNKLWLGESREGLVVDYMLYQDNPGDPVGQARHPTPGVEQELALKHVWGDRGLLSKANEEMLEDMASAAGFVPRDVGNWPIGLKTMPGFREGLKRRAGTEARIGIFKNVFHGASGAGEGI